MSERFMRYCKMCTNTLKNTQTHYCSRKCQRLAQLIKEHETINKEQKHKQYLRELDAYKAINK